MLDIDGSAGGGQQLRTALTLSSLDGRPFRMTEIRGSRPSPGLRPQHLAAVDAVTQLTDADVEGATVGSETLRFEPSRPPAGSVTVDVGTAGSIALVFDTVLPLAVAIDDPLSVTATGGTDVKWSPPLDFVRHVKLPLLARHGLAADVSVERRGFYPAGGGRATLHLAPSTLQPLDLRERGSISVSAHAVASAGLADARVCERALDALDGLSDLALPVRERTATYAETDSPGFALVVSVEGETRAGFDALGERGVPAETVADGVVEDIEQWLAGVGAVDSMLADQLMVPLALAGGIISAPAVTPHVETNRAVIEAFDVDLSISTDGSGATLSARGRTHPSE